MSIKKNAKNLVKKPIVSLTSVLLLSASFIVTDTLYSKAQAETKKADDINLPKTEDKKIDPTKADPAKTEEVKTEEVKAEIEKLEIEKTEAEKVEDEKAESDRAEMAKMDSPSTYTTADAPATLQAIQADFAKTPSTGSEDMETIVKKIFEKSSQGQSDSIEMALVSAYNTNPDIKEKRAAVGAADENIVQAKAGWRPQIEGRIAADASRKRNSGDTLRLSNAGQATTQNEQHRNKIAEISVSQNLFQGGGTVYATRQAKTEILSARADLAEAEQLVFVNAVDVYLSLLSKYVELELLKTSEDSFHKSLEVTTAKFQVGEETRTSVAQAEGEYARSVARRLTAEAQLEALRAQYERVMFRKPGNLTRPALPTGIPDNLEAVLECARVNNPQLIKAEYDEKSARHKVDVTQSGLMPTLDLVGSSRATLDRNKRSLKGTSSANLEHRWLNDRVSEHRIALEMKVPIYEQGITRSKTRQESWKAEQNRIGREIKRREVMQEAIKEWNTYIQAKEAVEAYKVRVRASQASLEGVQQEYAVGSKILLDVLNEMTRLIDSQQSLVESERIYNLAAYRIKYWMGKLDAKTMKLRVDLFDPTLHYNQIKNNI